MGGSLIYLTNPAFRPWWGQLKGLCAWQTPQIDKKQAGLGRRVALNPGTCSLDHPACECFQPGEELTFASIAIAGVSASFARPFTWS